VLGAPAESGGLGGERLLPFGRFTIVRDLGGARPAQIDDGVAREMMAVIFMRSFIACPGRCLHAGWRGGEHACNQTCENFERRWRALGDRSDLRERSLALWRSGRMGLIEKRQMQLHLCPPGARPTRRAVEESVNDGARASSKSLEDAECRR
jgi:hypothetical protein